MTALAVEKHAEPHNMGCTVVAVNSLIARNIGTKNAVWLCQAMYNQKKAGARQFWLKKVEADYDENRRMIRPRREIDQSFEYETGLTRSEQQTARREVMKLGVLTVKRSTLQGRLEFLIDLIRLDEVMRKWAEEESNTAHSTKQEDAILHAEFSTLESEILHSSTKNEKDSKDSRDPLPNTVDPQEKIASEHRLRNVSSRNTQKMNAEIAGIYCENNLDNHRISALLENYGEEKVLAAAEQVRNVRGRAYASAVLKLLPLTREDSTVEDTAIYIKSLEISKEEMERRAAAQKKAKALTKIERDKLREIFIEEKAGRSNTSFDFEKGIFLNPAEKLQFDRWLETRFMGTSLPKP